MEKIAFFIPPAFRTFLLGSATWYEKATWKSQKGVFQYTSSYPFHEFPFHLVESKWLNEYGAPHNNLFTINMFLCKIPPPQYYISTTILLEFHFYKTVWSMALKLLLIKWLCSYPVSNILHFNVAKYMEWHGKYLDCNFASKVAS